VAGLLFAVTLRTTIAGVFQSKRPELALSWYPNQANAAANLARRAIIAGYIPQGQHLARLAIARDPINATGYSALALAAEGQGSPVLASKLMTTAHAVSRRERIAEMWLIRQAIDNLDYQGAIHHFDIAMRSSARGVADLMPLLVASTVDPKMIDALRPVLRRNPYWKSSFLMSLAIGAPNAVDAVRLSRGQLDPHKQDERAVIARLIQRLADEHRYDLAWSVYREARPATADEAAGTLRDPEYVSAAGFPPLDWLLSEESDLTAVREARRDDRQGFALALIAEGGRSGEVARQLVRLTPGSHRLEFETGAVPADVSDRPLVSIACAGTIEPFFRTRPTQGGERPQRVSQSFTVPGGCKWQTVSVSIGSAVTPEDVPWIADVNIH
jgi:hypothetical protein